MAKYSRYAIGEVLLIMVGIFMALQLQNWNVERKQESQFKQSLEQLYNTINDDVSNYSQIKNLSRVAIKNIDFLLEIESPEVQVNYGGAYWYFFNFFRGIPQGLESVKAIDNIEYNPNDEDQVNLIRQLNSYREVLHSVSQNSFSLGESGRDYLIKNKIPQPGFWIDSIHFGMIDDSRFYNEEELQSAKQLIYDPYFRSLLKSQRSVLTFKHLDYKMLEEDSQSIMNLIESYYSEVRLLYQDVGIIGTSINGFDNVGAKSTPMTMVNKEENIWEVTIYLKVGRVKFRCRDSWAINWGGRDFPFGEALPDAGDIEVTEAGNYRILLNLTENTYEFIKLD